MASSKSIWFHLGHALERARLGGPAVGKTVSGLAERRARRVAERSEDPDALARPGLPSTDDLMAAGIAIVVDRALGGWGKRREPGFTGLVRAGAAGAVAALVVDLVRPLLRGNADFPALDRATADRLLAGIGHGLVYGAVVEPRIPGPALLKGAIYGSAEYATDTIGGLSGLLGSQTPQGRLPIVGEVLDGLDRHDRDYLEHVVFGICIALIYESSSSSNGIRPDEE
jgi:hypothetical protein